MCVCVRARARGHLLGSVVAWRIATFLLLMEPAALVLLVMLLLVLRLLLLPAAGDLEVTRLGCHTPVCTCRGEAVGSSSVCAL